MKLITEYVDEGISYSISEAKDSSERKVYIEGVFMQAEKKNRNGRVYTAKIMEKAVNRYINEYVITGRAIGELDHPSSASINLDKVSHRITELRMEGTNVIGKALILNTPMGNLVRGMIEGGVKLGVSSRGVGSITKKADGDYIDENFMLTTIDIVQDPSAPDAFVNGIMEGVEWILEEGILKPLEPKANVSADKQTKSLTEAFTLFLSKL